MENSGEIPKFQTGVIRRMSRRALLKKGVALGLGAAFSVFAGREILKADQHESGNTAPEGLGEPLGEPAQYQTIATEDNLGKIRWPIVRKGPTDQTALGYTEPSREITLQPVRGGTYPGWSGLGSQQDKNGRVYGIWYEGTFPLYDKAHKPKLDENSRQITVKGYISGNFAEKVEQPAK